MNEKGFKAANIKIKKYQKKKIWKEKTKTRTSMSFSYLKYPPVKNTKEENSSNCFYCFGFSS